MIARRLRVMLAIGDLGIGGTEGQLVQLASRLRATFDVSVVCIYGGGRLVAALRSQGVAVSVLGRQPAVWRGKLATPRRFVKALLSLWHLYRLLRQERPDIFHGFLYGAYVPGAIVARLAGVGVVISSRRSLGLFKERKRVMLAAERIATRFTDLVLANSPAVLADVRAQERIPYDRLRVVWNAVEPPRHRRSRDVVRASFGVPMTATCGVVVANLIAYKGHSYVVEAMPSVRSACGDVHILLVGDGPERARLEKLARDRGVSDLVHFCGATDDVGSYIHAADFGVLPSLQEGLSNAVLEMMAAGLPVIATCVGGNVDILRNEVNGALVRPADPAELAGSIVRVVQNPDLRHRLGAAAKADVEQRFSYEALVANMSAIYRELAERRTR